MRCKPVGAKLPRGVEYPERAVETGQVKEPFDDSTCIVCVLKSMWIKAVALAAATP